MVTAIVVFAVGSTLCGAAQSMTMLIVGRTIQGSAGGAILTVCEILVVDLVPIAERGKFFGILGAVWAAASALGPPVAGALASSGQWRWLFYREYLFELLPRETVGIEDNFADTVFRLR